MSAVVRPATPKDVDLRIAERCDDATEEEEDNSAKEDDDKGPVWGRDDLTATNILSSLVPCRLERTMARASRSAASACRLPSASARTTSFIRCRERSARPDVDISAQHTRFFF